MPLKSGPMVGDHVASFYTRAVTGPLMNKSVCYVCRNGQRPVVMILLRRVDAELKPLMKSLDKLVDGNRAVGLRGFGVLIDNNSVQATSAVQTFAFNNMISIPLTISGEAVAAASGQKIHRDAAITIVLYRKRKVVATFSFRSGELKAADVQRVLKRVRRLIGDEKNE